MGRGGRAFRPNIGLQPTPFGIRSYLAPAFRRKPGIVRSSASVKETTPAPRCSSSATSRDIPPLALLATRWYNN